MFLTLDTLMCFVSSEQGLGSSGDIRFFALSLLEEPFCHFGPSCQLHIFTQKQKLYNDKKMTFSLGSKTDVYFSQCFEQFMLEVKTTEIYSWFEVNCCPQHHPWEILKGSETVKINSSFGIYCAREGGFWKNIGKHLKHLFCHWGTFISHLVNNYWLSNKWPLRDME